MKETTRNFHRHKRPAGNRQRPIVNVLLRLVFLQALPLLLLAACVSPSERKHMEAMLTDYEQRNSQYDTLSIDSTRRLADFFSRHGDAHQRMRAYYLLGCVHETAGESPQALDMFYKSLEQADTTAKDCDYKRLSRIHGQIASLFNKQRAPELEINAEKRAVNYALKSKDTLAAIIYYEFLSVPYYFKGQKDSALLIAQNTLDLFNKYGTTIHIKSAYQKVIFYSVEKKDFDYALQLIKNYDKLYCKYDKKGNEIGELGIYYYNKARCYEGKEELDSSLFYYKKLTQKFKDLNNTEAAYKGLMSVYEKAGIADSAVKYATLYCDLNDSASIASSSEEIIRMHTLYNYNASERKAKEKEREALNYRRTVWAVLITVLVLAFWIYQYIKRQKEVKRKELMAANEEYALLLFQYNQIQKDLKLSQIDSSTFQHEKEVEVEELKRKLAVLQGTPAIVENWSIEQAKLYSPLIMELHKLASKVQKPSQKIWDDFLYSMQKEFPEFIDKLNNSEVRLTDQELLTAALIRLQFTQGELSALLGVSKQRTNNLKRNINRKLFKEEGASTLNNNINKL
ncbi:MAG: hypothetical protein IKH86_03575 [Prevotella sp.]|nr:hypothetical protein [Prevotella sp.]